MKTRIHFSAVLAFTFIALAFQSCVRDKCVRESTFTKYSPVYMSYEELREAVAPEAPRSLQHPGKIYFIGSTVLINEFDKGVHVIDNADPSNPQNIAFINIPGNADMAVRGNVLYADSYIDLVAIDISNPGGAREVGRAQDVFPQRVYNSGFGGDPALGVIADWDKETVTEEMDCNMSGGWNSFEDGLMFGDNLASTGAPGPTATGFNAPGTGNREVVGMGGSMARFALVDVFLYVVDNSDLHVFNVANLHEPEKTGDVKVGFNIETIWSYGAHLFIGSQSGMHIYGVTTPGQPEFFSTYEHITSCDPVVVSGNYAYVTLRSGTPCWGFTNQLEVVDITDLRHPQLLHTFSMSNPHGLGVDGETLFICDGDQGLKVYDKTDISKITGNLIVAYPSINAYDVIPYGGVAMMIGAHGFYQYDYSDLSNIRLLSVIPVEGL